MNILYCAFFYNIIYLLVKCEDNSVESKNPLPYFRRKVEESIGDETTQSSETESTSSNLVSFFIKNLRKIYNDLGEIENMQISSPLTTTVAVPSENNVISDKDIIAHTFIRTKKPVIDIFVRSNTSNTPKFDEMVEFGHTSVVNAKDKINDKKSSTTTSKHLGKENFNTQSLIFETDRRGRRINTDAENASNPPPRGGIRRTCVYCDNVEMENCIDPKNHLVPSTVCEHEDDVCYSQHTPFGIIDRGCFNVNYNLTTYVCSCNLCNYISISEMPFLFTTRQAWLDNVVELSRMKHLRKSVFRQMSCFQCESSSVIKSDNLVDTANCLEGNMGTLPVQECAEDEICAVKTVKHNGYIWRGCVKEPLFNYWWRFCESDLCNHDRVTSIFDV